MRREVVLNNGVEMPVVGFGTSSDGKLNAEAVKVAVKEAIQVGYRHFDTANVYGTEHPLGEALQEAFEAGTIERHQVFVTSKLSLISNHPDLVIPALQNCLRLLQLDYIDLYLIHWPILYKEGARFPFQEGDLLPIDMKGTWQALERCVDEGLARAIGLSNFSSKKIKDLLTYARIPPSVVQVEMHPKWQQKTLREFCREANIHITAWSPLGAPQRTFGTSEVINHPIIKEIAFKHGKTSAQVLLRWGLEQGVSMIPKSFNKERMMENMDIFDWVLSKDDHEKIATIEQKKNVDGSFFMRIATSPYKSIEDFWDGEI